MTKQIIRPLDLLNNSKSKQVMVTLTSGKVFSGNLVAFDIHINVVLENAREVTDGEQASNIGYAFFRGESVVLISPSSM